MRETTPALAGGWQVVRGSDSFLHVMPEHDALPHICSFDCGCGPRRDEVCGVIVVHNAADNRERYEAKEVM